MTSPLHGFLIDTYGSVNQRWIRQYVQDAAGKQAPEGLHGPAHWLLTGDIHILWARWFAEGIADPNRYLGVEVPYAHVYEEVRAHVGIVLNEQPDPEKDDLAEQLSGLIVEEIQRRKDIPGRNDWPPALREKLWDEGGNPTRCWICGYVFTDVASDRFLRVDGAVADHPLPPYVDVFQPRGLNAASVGIQVDHVGALAAGGGEDDLRLACGWCNNAKTDRSLFYDAAAVMPWFDHPHAGRIGVPHRFWIVRALAMQQQCQYIDGCLRTVHDTEMRVATQRSAGSPNPINLRVFCPDHDPMAGHRFVPRESYDERLHRSR